MLCPVTASTPPPTPALADPPEGADLFTQTYRVRTGDVDQRTRVRLDATARYLQDIANDNIEATAFHDTDPFWIVRRTVVDVIEPITWPADVTLQRWCAALSTRWTNMRVRITAEHETNRFNPRMRPPGLIETEAFWINVTEQGLPARLTDDAFAMLAATTDEHRLRWRSMHPTPLPDDDGTDRRHVLRSTDFDPFHHLNNAAYWEAVEDELVDHRDIVDAPHRAIVEYLRPITPGASVTLRRRRVGDALLLWMIVDEQVAATVSVTRTPR